METWKRIESSNENTYLSVYNRRIDEVGTGSWHGASLSRSFLRNVHGCYGEWTWTNVECRNPPPRRGRPRDFQARPLPLIPSTKRAAAARKCPPPPSPPPQSYLISTFARPFSSSRRNIPNLFPRSVFFGFEFGRSSKKTARLFNNPIRTNDSMHLICRVHLWLRIDR